MDLNIKVFESMVKRMEKESGHIVTANFMKVGLGMEGDKGMEFNSCKVDKNIEEIE